MYVFNKTILTKIRKYKCSVVFFLVPISFILLKLLYRFDAFIRFTQAVHASEVPFPVPYEQLLVLLDTLLADHKVPRANSHLHVQRPAVQLVPAVVVDEPCNIFWIIELSISRRNKYKRAEIITWRNSFSLYFLEDRFLREWFFLQPGVISHRSRVNLHRGVSAEVVVHSSRFLHFNRPLVALFLCYELSRVLSDHRVWK